MFFLKHPMYFGRYNVKFSICKCQRILVVIFSTSNEALMFFDLLSKVVVVQSCHSVSWSLLIFLRSINLHFHLL